MLRDTAPEIKEGLRVATRRPFICPWNRGKDLFTDSPYTGPCMCRSGILSCHKDYGSGFLVQQWFNLLYPEKKWSCLGAVLLVERWRWLWQSGQRTEGICHFVSPVPFLGGDEGLSTGWGPLRKEVVGRDGAKRESPGLPLTGSVTLAIHDS